MQDVAETEPRLRHVVSSENVQHCRLPAGGRRPISAGRFKQHKNFVAIIFADTPISKKTNYIVNKTPYFRFCGFGLDSMQATDQALNKRREQLQAQKCSAKRAQEQISEIEIKGKTIIVKINAQPTTPQPEIEESVGEYRQMGYTYDAWKIAR